MTADERAQLEERIEALRYQGWGYFRIARLLNEQGVPTPSGEGRWHASSVKRTLDPEAWNMYVREWRAR